ncbi:MAG TPA: hypothetical protein VHP36_10430 [Chitinispirillaceae bacterium]|nr:hypothetical protein [Chitinispirillaceae bacterium]
MTKKLLSVVLGAGLLFNLFAEIKIDDPDRISGSGYFEVGVTHLNLDPMEKIVKEFDGKVFDFDNNAFVSFGMAGYVGQKRNGLRAGLGLWGGYNSTFSNEWRSVAQNNVAVNSEASLDSVIKLHMGFLHGGFLVEKSFLIKPRMNIYTGGMIGGGVMMALAEFMPANNAFRDVDDSDYDDDDYYYDDDNDNDNLKMALATYWAFDVHAGATYTFTRWLHLGLDFSTLFQYSSSGFGNRSSSILTANPGIRLRFIFGTSV